MAREQRWYKLDGRIAYVYDAPHEAHATAVSIVDVADLQYYRNNFRLTKLWTFV